MRGKVTCENCGAMVTLNDIGQIGYRIQQPAYARQPSMRGYALCSHCAKKEDDHPEPIRPPSTGGGKRVFRKSTGD